jgi:hypothetical protein
MSWLGKKIYNFLNRKWFFDKIYNEYFGQFFFKFGYSISYKFIDRGIFEILGPTGCLQRLLLFQVYIICKQVTYTITLCLF